MVADHDLDYGKWETGPNNLIDSDDGQEAFKAEGRAYIPSGTQGYVIYEAFDGTQFKIEFDIRGYLNPKDNSISSEMPSGHGNPSNFTFMRTASNYETPETSGDPGSSPVTVYYLIEKK